MLSLKKRLLYQTYLDDVEEYTCCNAETTAFHQLFTRSSIPLVLRYLNLNSLTDQLNSQLNESVE